MGVTLKRAFKFALIFVILASPFIALAKHEAIYDWWRLRDYTPPAEVVALASDVQMTDHGRHLFYINHPQIVDEESRFRQECTTYEETIVLGCYRPNQQGIFVYKVKDQRLAGVTQVTSAHEMLHAAYDRLGAAERQKIDKLLNNYYRNELGDDRIKESIDSYRQTEPDDLTNEMHSIFATEIFVLPQELETYYSLYFKNRQAVVAYSEQYEGEFTSRKNQASGLDDRIKTLRAQIDTQEVALKAELAEIEDQRGEADTQAEVNEFNRKVESYNARVNQLKRLIDEHNRLIEEYNQLTGEIKTLYDAIDTRLDTTSGH